MLSWMLSGTKCVVARATNRADISPDLALWYFLFCTSSVAMQLLNKAIAASFRQTGVVSLDNVLLAWQQVAAVALNLFLVRCVGGNMWKMKPVTRAQVVRLALPSANFILMLLCSLKALKTVHIATVVVARNLCTPIICAGELLIFRKAESGSRILCLAVIVFGSIIYAFDDLTYDFWGYFWQCANTMLFVVGQLYEKWAMDQSSDQTALGVSTLKNALSLIVLGILCTVQGDWRFDGIDRVPPATWAFIIITGVGCNALSVCYMTLYKISSATAVTVGGNFNKVVSIVLGALIFRAPLGFTQTMGLLICILGSLLYSLGPKLIRNGNHDGKRA